MPRRRERAALADPELVAMVLDWRMQLRALAEVIARKGPSTPNRNAVNRERTERRKDARRAIRAIEHQIAVRCSHFVPRKETDA